jgi:repressor LexA
MPKADAQVIRGEETRKAILAFIVSFAKDRGFSPTVREIGDAVGLSSSSTIQSHLNRLQMDRKITRDPLLARSIRITK